MAINKRMSLATAIWKGNTCQTTIKFNRRNIGVTLTAPSTRKGDLGYTLRNIDSRIVHPSVQNALCEDLNIPHARQVKAIKIDPKLERNYKHFDARKGTVFMSLHAAEHLLGNDIAIVLGGGALKGFVYPGILRWLESIGMKKGKLGKSKLKFFCTSTGAYFGSLYCAHGSAKAMRNRVYKTLQEKEMFDFLDPDFAGLQSPSTYDGVLHGNKLMDIIRLDCGLGDQTFSQMKVPLFIYAVNTANYNGWLFGDPKYNDEFILNPEYEPGSGEKERVQRLYPIDIRVIDAARASGSIPIGFKYYRIGDMVFVDGGVKQNVAIKAATSSFANRYVIAFNLGISLLSGDVKNVGDTAANYTDGCGLSQMDALSLSYIQDRKIIVFNPMVGRVVNNANGMELAHPMEMSALETLRDFEEIVMPSGQFDKRLFFPPYSTGKKLKLKEKFKLKKKGSKSPSILCLDHKNPPIEKPKDDPWWYCAFILDGGRIWPKLKSKTLEQWALLTFIKQNGIFRSASVFLSYLMLKYGFFKKKK
ncbi:patatin-like phospholipase family protein [Candidatus Margulisiibacteriota bacterium]